MSHLLIEFFASFLIWLMYAGLLVLWVIDGKIKKEQVTHALLASFLAWVVAEILRNIFRTVRPFILDGSQPLTLTVPRNGAFPSGHTAGAFALATMIWLHDRKVGWFYLISALVVGVARVLANVHYPIDILGGAILGIFTSFAVEKIHFRKLFKK